MGPRNELEQALVAETALGTALDALTSGYLADFRSRTLLELEALNGVSEERASAPQFVLAHLPSPHRPFVFNADCSPRPADQYSLGSIGRTDRAGGAESIAASRNQTVCVDRLLADAVRGLVERRPDAVVLVLSDHGPEERLDWRAPGEPGLRDRFANLFWARTPTHSGLFPADITLVNVMPILFNAYLGTDLPLHDDDLYYGPAQNLDRFVPYAGNP